MPISSPSGPSSDSNYGDPTLSVPDTGLRDRPDRFSSDEYTYMARRRASSGRRGGGRGKTTVNKVFTPAFTLKGGYGKKRSGGKSRS